MVGGSVWLPTAPATRLRGEDLASSEPDAWRRLRAALERRQEVRTGAGGFAATLLGHFENMNND